MNTGHHNRAHKHIIATLAWQDSGVPCVWGLQKQPCSSAAAAATPAYSTPQVWREEHTHVATTGAARMHSLAQHTATTSTGPFDSEMMMMMHLQDRSQKLTRLPLLSSHNRRLLIKEQPRCRNWSNSPKLLFFLFSHRKKESPPQHHSSFSQPTSPTRTHTLESLPFSSTHKGSWPSCHCRNPGRTTTCMQLDFEHLACAQIHSSLPGLRIHNQQRTHTKRI